MTCHYEYRVPRCQHIKTNGTQCGSPAMRNIEYCYFHYRWRMTTVDLSHSAHHVTTEFVLPVLEDADSIQITLGQIIRMIVCRQVDTKSAGLLLYGLQIASSNLRRTQFEPYHKDVTVDLFRVPERIIGDEAWSPSDFAKPNGGRASSPAKPPSSAKESSPQKQSDVGRASPLASVARTPPSAKESSPAKETHVALASSPDMPSSANQSSPQKQSDVGRASPLANRPPAQPSPAKETLVARTPSSAKEPSPTNESSPEKQSDVGRASPLASVARTLLSAKEPSPANESSPHKQSDVGRASPLANAPSCAKEPCASPTPPKPQPKAPSPATQPAPASNVSSSSLPSATQQRELQKAERAMAGALKGDWRDVKTLFEFAGIFPPKDNTSPTDA